MKEPSDPGQRDGPDAIARNPALEPAQGPPDGPHDGHPVDWTQVQRSLTARVARMLWDRPRLAQAADHQDIVAEALRRLLEYPPAEAARLVRTGWLWQTAVNLVRDLARRTSIEDAALVALASEAHTSDVEGSMWTDPETRAELGDLWATFESRLLELPPPFQQVLWLQYVAGWTRSEVVRWLQLWRPISDRQAERLLDEARFVLRGLLAPRGDHDTAAAMGRRRRRDAALAKFSRHFSAPPPPFVRSRGQESGPPSTIAIDHVP